MKTWAKAALVGVLSQVLTLVLLLAGMGIVKALPALDQPLGIIVSIGAFILSPFTFILGSEGGALQPPGYQPPFFDRYPQLTFLFNVLLYTLICYVILRWRKSKPTRNS